MLRMVITFEMNTNIAHYLCQNNGSKLGDNARVKSSIGHLFQKDHLHIFRLIICLCLWLFLAGGKIIAQTDFAPGEIMFTGYDSDAPDGFSFVLLRDVASGTVIAITD